MGKSVLLLGLFIWPLGVEAQTAPDYSGLTRYQGTSSRDEIMTRLNLLKKNNQVDDHFEVRADGIAIYDSAASKQAGRPEYFVRFGTSTNMGAVVPKKGDPKLPLVGTKIAIDPGHFGGKIGKELEGRYIDLGPRPDKNIPDRIQFEEGTLSYLTAVKLARRLESQGAKVMITRESIDRGAHPLTFEEWKKSPLFFEAVERNVKSIQDPVKRQAAQQWWLKTAKDPEIFFNLYNKDDLRARAQKINQFDPDLSLVLHYNAAAGNDKATGKNLGSDENYSMVFVPGAYMVGELAAPDARVNFARLLMSRHLDESIRASREVEREFIKTLKVPAVSAGANLKYLNASCNLVEPGVYARNLGLTGMVKSPICYGEACCQDNFEECLRLSKKDGVIDGVQTSSRLEQVADSYYNGVLKFFGVSNAEAATQSGAQDCPPGILPGAQSVSPDLKKQTTHPVIEHNASGKSDVQTRPAQ